MSFWREYLNAISATFDVPRPLAALLCVLPVLFLVAMIVQTWFIWAGIFVVALFTLVTLWVVECALRLWYRIHGDIESPVSVPQNLSVALSPPSPLRATCAGAQGRIRDAELSGDYVSALAHQILAGAAVRPAPAKSPRWLRFPAISRAAPRLAHLVQLVVRLCTQ